MEHLRDDPAVRDVLRTSTVGSALRFKGLTVVPLVRPNHYDPDWVLVDEAITGGTFEVTEVTESGSVPRLQVKNRGDQAVLLLDGAELVGAKQNRVLNTTVLVGVGQSVQIPVSCVEQGRWAYRSRRFSPSDRSLYASARRQKVAQVHDSLRGARGYASDQSAIWMDLDKKALALAVSSATHAMGDVFDAHKTDVGNYRRALVAQPGQIGAIVYGGVTWWGLELLPSPRLFAAAWPRLLSGYAMDALWADVSGVPEVPGTCVEAALASRAEVFPGVGLGDEYRFRARGIVGAALVAEGIVAHVMAFPR
jgi:hypothetical protein